MQVDAIPRAAGALIVTLCVLSPPASGAVQGASTLPLSPCRLEHPFGLGSVAARCGQLVVPENPDDPSGRSIALAVAVVPAVSARARPDPLFLLAGGPGQGARDGYVPILGALAGVRRDRDLVLVDQRGTGQSNPMNCDFPEEALVPEVEPETFRRMASD